VDHLERVGENGNSYTVIDVHSALCTSITVKVIKLCLQSKPMHRRL
jgi:hypothetical protein